MSHFRLLPLVALCLVTSSADALVPSGVDPNNIIVSTDRRLYEFTPDGQQVQDLGEVPHPETTSSSQYTPVDVVVDQRGNLHVLNASTFYGSYLSHYSFATGEWTHTLDPYYPGLGNLHNGDLSVYGDLAVSRTSIYNLATGTVIPHGIENANEVSFGLDGRLYASGTNRLALSGVRIYDRITLELQDQFELMDESDMPVPARGITANTAGELYVADVGGLVRHYSPDGMLLDSLELDVVDLSNINLRWDGEIVLGTWRGTIVLTDASLKTFSRFASPPGDSLVYASWAVNVPEPPSRALLACCGAIATAIGYRRLHWSAS